MVKEHDFKKCNQAGFCKRNRQLADTAAESGSSWTSPYALSPDSISVKEGQVQATILKTINKYEETANLPITISFLESGVARVTVDEEVRQKKDIDLRHNSAARKERYNEVEHFAIVGGLALDKGAQVTSQDKLQMTVKFGPSHKHEAVIQFAPFSMDFKRDGQSQVKFNDRGLLNMDHWRPKVETVVDVKFEDEEDAQKPEGEPEIEKVKQEDESTWWDESFGGNTDTKPKGPESVGLDISFVGYDHVYGIPSHAGPLCLKETRGGEGNYAEPYRMYNSDVFEYILDSPMTLYGSIPYMQAHRKASTVGVFWLNAAETWVDIIKSKESRALGMGSKTSTQTHWISESGLLDVFVFLGPTPKDLSTKFSELTGTTAMPQEFSLGYHQCRWNYISDEDVKDVDRKMDKFKIPYDVIWLDIEFADDKMYFKYDENMFKDPIGMSKALDEHSRKVVLINDPHLKKKDGYYITDNAKSKDLLVHNKNNDVYEGHCWPGGSHWLDAFNPAAIEWWKEQFKYDKFIGSAPNQFTWNDMNEPSVFNGPETTMPKDNLHFENWEHRDVHNLNGMTFHNATYQALLSRKQGELQRPFVLTRSFYAGSQRYGAMWTGDNQAEWSHLGAALPMLLSQGISGFPFSGSDVGGFFGNPDKELQTRWYQGGAFYPFFRGHAHIDARRREPYLAGEPYTQIITEALRLRYSLLPSWYTAFHQAHVDGTPIIKPMFYTHPNEASGFKVDDQLFVGSTGLLHKPVVQEGQETVDIYIPDDEVYYDYFTYDIISTQKGKTTTLAAPLDKIPLLMRGGHIFPRRDTPRRSSGLMRFDDYTLVVSLANDGTAEGDLYVDDGESFDYEEGQYITRKFILDDNAITSVDAEGRDPKSIVPGEWMKAMHMVQVSKILVVGVPNSWTSKKEVEVESDGRTWTAPVDFVPAEKGRAAYAVIRGLGVRVGDDWAVKTT
ncbi:putative glycoside hydrolase family 31 protein [Zalerion maritima]|uniref:alpha-glucosidase n=1 Tax=Zalerion maritima TaxID=339359 RepID=A0AAD5RFR6_9PEZI|nr:putative glycoside hydrolase family 31 protein [Zalerion maritima]